MSDTPYTLGQKVRYRPYHYDASCYPDGWHPDPFRVVTVITTQHINWERPTVTYSVQRWAGEASNAWNVTRPIVMVSAPQLAPWPEPEKDTE